MKIDELLPHDKALHLIAGFVIFAVFHFINPFITLAIVILAAVSKEIYDKLSNTGTPETNDVWFTILGGALGLICSL